MDLERPRFRHDLVARPLEDAGIFYVDVTDPSSGAEFRFYDVEYSIACAMDGDRNIDGLVAWTRAELGVETSTEELKTVVSTLAGLGYLDGARPAAGKVEVVDLSGAAATPAAASPSGLRFDDAESTRHAPAEAARAAAQMADEFSDEPTRNVAIPLANEVAVDSGLVEMEMTVSAAQRAEDAGPAAAGYPGDIPTGGAADDDLEVDLSAHVDVNKDKVRDAVRQSRAVAVPSVADVADVIGGLDAEAADAAGSRPVEVSRTGSVATKLPTAPPEASPAAAAASVPAPSSSSMGLFAMLLLLAIAGSAAYYFLVYKQRQDLPQAPPRAMVEPEAAKPAPLPTGMLSSTEAPASTITAPVAGAIEWMVADELVVASGDVVAKYAGARRAEQALAQAKDRLLFYQNEVSRLNASGNVAGATSVQKKVDEKQALVDQAQAVLAPLVLTAPSSGPVQALVGPGARVAEGDPVVRVVPKDFIFTVEFKDAPVGLLVGAPVKLAPTGQADRQVAGLVDKVDGEIVLVRVVPPVDLAPGTSLTLLAP